MEQEQIFELFKLEGSYPVKHKNLKGESVTYDILTCENVIGTLRELKNNGRVKDICDISEIMEAILEGGEGLLNIKDSPTKEYLMDSRFSLPIYLPVFLLFGGINNEGLMRFKIEHELVQNVLFPPEKEGIKSNILAMDASIYSKSRGTEYILVKGDLNKPMYTNMLDMIIISADKYNDLINQQGVDINQLSEQEWIKAGAFKDCLDNESEIYKNDLLIDIVSGTNNPSDEKSEAAIDLLKRFCQQGNNNEPKKISISIEKKDKYNIKCCNTSAYNRENRGDVSYSFRQITTPPTFLLRTNK